VEDEETSRRKESEGWVESNWREGVL
jgi:hypothetical protein